VQEALEEALSLLKDAETGQRGFLITGEEGYLKPYDDAVAALGPQLDKLDGLVAADAELRQGVAELRRLAGAKLAELGRVLDVRRAQGPEPARRLVLEGAGRRAMDAVRTLVAALEAREHDLLDERRRAADASLNTVTRTNALAAAVGMGLVGLAYGLY